MRKFFASILFFTLFINFSYSQDKMVIAVSPFKNLAGNNVENYVGFQISEYMTSALASIDGVSVVERGMLEKVLKEQNFQLSGMTEAKNAVELGNLVNAKQMLVGSYTINHNTINIKGRIVDVETAKITASANVSGSFTGDINPVMYDFFYALLDKNPPEEVFSQMSVLEQRISKLELEKNESFAAEIKKLQEQMTNLENTGKNLKNTLSSFKISLAVEAQLSMLKDMDQDTSADAAKALEASFENNNKKALEYLQSAIADPTKNYLSYSLSADSYYEKLSAVEGESFFVKMVKNQLEVNKVLSKDAEAISKYRNTLKLLVNRLYAVLYPDMFTLNIGKTEQVEMGTVSAIITLPSNISINVNTGTRQLLNRVLDTQDLIGISNKKYSYAENLVFKTDPPLLKKLLPNSGIKELFPISLNAGIGYSIQFIDKNENILFELLHDNVKSFNLTTDSDIVWGKESGNSYKVKEAKDGWSFRNGKVEVQARELRNLHGVRVVLDRRSFIMNYSFPVYSDTKWKSILLHSYRQKYIKISLDDVEDPMPQVKDIVITHSVFSVGTYLDGIPLLVNPDYVAGISDLTAIVYWGDSSNTVVTGEWTGVKKYSSENISGALNSESVLYFSMPAVMKNGKEVFILGNNSQSKIVSFSTILGTSWKNNIIGSDQILVEKDRIYIASGDYGEGYTASLNSNTGVLLWQNGSVRSDNLKVSKNNIITSYVRHGDYSFSYVTSLNADTGSLVWKNDDISGYSLQIIGSKIYTAGSFYSNSPSCIDFESGKILWNNRSVRSTDIEVLSGKAYVAFRTYTACLDAESGQIIWKNNDVGSSKLYVVGNRVYTVISNYISCLNADTGRLLWKNKDIRSSDLKIINNHIYTSGRMHCLDAGTGRVLWTNPNFYSTDFQIVNEKVYSIDKDQTSCLNAGTGNIIWNNTVNTGSKIQMINGKVYTSKDNSTQCLDVSTIESWYNLKSSGDSYYNMNSYLEASAQYSKAISVEGSKNAMVLYRDAYSREQVGGLTTSVKNEYFKAWVRLKEQYPGHRYIAAAEKKIN